MPNCSSFNGPREIYYRRKQLRIFFLIVYTCSKPSARESGGACAMDAAQNMGI
jgi:hypothetical protein